MRQSVIDKWHAFSDPLEGKVFSMYLDIKGLITTGVGNLINAVSEALKLPWRHEATGELATPEEVTDAWKELKSRQDLAKLHYKYAAALNDLRLSEEAVDELVRSKLLEFYAYLKRVHFPDIDSWPADAQLGTMSMAWACGPGFPQTFKNFKRAVLAGDWEGARAACKIRETNNPGVVPRNAHNRTCFSNAAIVVKNGLDREKLHWPGSPPLEDDPPPVEPLTEDDKPLAPAVQVIDGAWIGDAQLGLPDDVRDDIAEQKRKDIADK
jgi:GH24 family phage-related lysozyme (muramidase)